MNKKLKNIGLAFGTAALTIGVSEAMSWYQGRKGVEQDVVLAAAQQAINSGDCNLKTVRGKTFPYEGTTDFLHFDRVKGEVTVGRDITRAYADSSRGDVDMQLSLTDRDYGPVIDFLTRDPWGNFHTISQPCAKIKLTQGN